MTPVLPALLERRSHTVLLLLAIVGGCNGAGETLPNQDTGTEGECAEVTEEPACMLATESADYGANGTVDYGFEYSYDPDGNLLSEEEIDGAGRVELTYVYSYEGGHISRQYRVDPEGVQSYIGTYAYDATGDLLTFEQDADADGMIDYACTYTYDEHGDVLTSHVDGSPDGTGGTDSTQVTYTYDDHRNLLTMTTETVLQLVDGECVQRRAYSYDDGNLSILEGDGNCNHGGDADETDTADGTVDWRDVYTYDAAGDVLTEEDDRGADGDTDLRYTYTYNEYGEELTEDLWVEWTEANARWTSIYDCSGNLLVYESDQGADGVVEERTTQTFDDSGNLLTSELDSGADGVPESRASYSYDSHGNVLTYESDSDGNVADGSPDFRVTYTYGGC